MWVELIITLVLGIIIIHVSIRLITSISTRERDKLLKLFIFSYSLILITGTIAYKIETQHNKEKKNMTLFEFINNGKIDKSFVFRILIGFISGIVFGIIDNVGLWYGMDMLDPILPKGILTKAGLSNAFSDTLGAVLAAFVGNIIQNLSSVTSKTPLWANALGTFCGCITGVYLSRSVTGRK